MKNLLKRFVICFLSVILLVSVACFFACDKVEQGNNSSSEQSEESQSSTKDSSITSSDGESSSPADSSSTGADSSSDSSSSSSSDSSTENSSDSSSDSSSSGSDDPLPDPDEPEYKVVNGNITETDGTLRSTAANSIAIHKTGEFSQGTISAKITLMGKGGDNGIVFGLKNLNNLENFWENEGIYYYFFFISNAGTAYLGKVSNKSWKICGETPIANFKNTGTYTLEVARDKSASDYDYIRCYVNGELYVSYKDGEHHDGVGFGVRTGVSDISFSDITLSDEIKGSASTLEGFTVANGVFEADGDAIVSSTGKAIAEKTDGEFIYGTLQVTLSPNGNRTDNGLIFGLTSNAIHSYWESDVSYYFFFLSLDGFAFLGKVNNGTWESCQFVTVPGYSEGKTYTIKVERDATTIYGYVNDVCYVTYADSFPLTGTGYGVRAASAGVKFSNLTCNSSGEITETYPENVEAVSGKVLGSDGAIRSGANQTVALMKEATLTEGTFKASVRGVSTKRSGLIFNYSKDATTESYYRFVSVKDSQRVEIDKVVNGVATTIYSNYLSAGYSSGNLYDFKVVLSAGKAYCYFWNTLYHTFTVELSGNRVGFYAEGPGTQFSVYSVSSQTEIVKVDTLLFGHSYFELWSNYVRDFAPVAEEFNLGSYTNIGIGGSVASHWYKFKEGLVAYEASQVVYMIGINDLTGGTSPKAVVDSIKETLLYMKEAKPELKVVLLSVNHCPARSNIVSAISETNVKMQELCSQYDWISYAEMEYAFCDNGTIPDSYWFTDGLHPTANGYVQKIVPAIRGALLSEGQPELDAETKLKLLNEAKELKKDALIDYSEWSYRSAEWATAKPYYEEAVMLIDACETIEEVNALDLSTVIASLKAIKRNGDYVNDELAKGTQIDVWETETLKNALDSSANGVYNVEHDGHRIATNIEYTDMSFTFCLSDITAEFATVGILFRAKQTTSLGIEGYMINIVTEQDYIQIWYFNNAYGSGSIGTNMTYIGGWVFPNEVENTLFRAIIKGDNCYIYTEEDYQTKGASAYGCSADLTYNGQFNSWDSGYLGINCWASYNSAKGKLSIQNISGTVAEKAEEPTKVDYTSQIIAGLKGSENVHSVSPELIKGGENGKFDLSGFAFKLYTAVEVSDFTMVVDAKSLVDVGVAGFLFRCKPNGTNAGVDGYLMNYVSNANSQFIQIYYLKNAYSANGGVEVCDYIGGWVFPGKVLENQFTVTVKGDNVTLQAGGQVLSVSLTGAQIGATYPVYSEGSFGLLSWQNSASSLTISSIIA